MRSTTRFALTIVVIGAPLNAFAQPIPPAQQTPSGQLVPGQPAPSQTGPVQPPPGPQPGPPPGPYPQGQPTPGPSTQAQPVSGSYPQAQPQGQPPPGQYQQSPPPRGPSARPAPGDGTVETLDTSAPAAPVSESATAPDLAWYRPISADTALEARSHERFVTGMFNSHSFLAGPIRGNGSEVLASFNFNTIWAVGVGAYMPNASFVVGADFFRYAGINLANRKRSFGLTILVPTVEVRYVVGTNVLYAGSGLTGLRITACPIVIDLRLPNVTVWQPIPFDEASRPSVSVGGTASLGFMF